MCMIEYLGYLLHHCSKFKAIRNGFALHAAAVKSGHLGNVVLSNHVVNMYGKCGGILYAHKLFDEMPAKNLVSWAALISGCDQAGESLLAIELYSRMRLVPNEFVFASVLSACASLTYFTLGQQVHAQSLKLGYASVSFVSNALISLYMKCGLCNDAFTVFSSLVEPNSVSYNAFIAGFVENGKPAMGLEMFKLMHHQGLVPDCFSFAGALEACTNTEDRLKGLQLHCQTIKVNLDSTPFVGNVIIAMYSKFNMMEEAEMVFRLIEEKDVISWNTLIAASSQGTDYMKGLNLFRDLIKQISVSPDDFTFSSVLAACAGLASLCHGKQIHAHLIKTRLNQDIVVDNALLSMYAKCGSVQHAYSMFSQMENPNLVSWNSVIVGFGNHGLGKKALSLFEQMKESGLKPDSVTFLALLTGFNHAGLVEEAETLFNSMEQVYDINPETQHISCLIDILGRAGRLADAERYVNKFQFNNDPVVLGSLLSACRLHGELAVGERMCETLLKLEPVSTSPFVLLSNLYALDSMWSGVAEMRKMLKGSGLRKEPGFSLIEVKGKVEKFTIGDFSHSSINAVKDVLDLLSLEANELLTLNPVFP